MRKNKINRDFLIGRNAIVFILVVVVGRRMKIKMFPKETEKTKVKILF